jgi:CheY-like chemotaxis protein
MNRPCFLVIDREFPGSISTRKLVIETAKFNVLTAYSGKEALEVFTRFPAVSGIVLDGGLDDVSSSEVAREVRRLQPKMPIIGTRAYWRPKPTINSNRSIRRC